MGVEFETDSKMALGNEVVARNDPAEESEPEEEEEVDLIDPVDEIRENCNHSNDVGKLKSVLEACTERVSSKNETTETCHEEVIDYIHALDTCVSKSLFTKLK